nr:MAG TPA: hypothetical protein [Bacteriophage sp.]
MLRREASSRRVCVRGEKLCCFLQQSERQCS